MSTEIAELRREDVEELRQFLVTGFKTSPDFVGFLPAVLNWKYLSHEDGFAKPKSLLLRQDGRIVAHVGFSYREFAIGSSKQLLLHPIDWYSCAENPGAGASLMLQVFEHAPIQYVIGGTAEARRAHKLMGYEIANEITVYRKNLRAWYPLTKESGNLIARTARSMRNVVNTWRHWEKRSDEKIDVVETSAFDDETIRFPQSAAGLPVSQRSSRLLNHYLNFPTREHTGLLVHRDGVYIGFAVLHTHVLQGVRLGKICECTLETDNRDIWTAVYRALCGRLAAAGVDRVSTFGSTVECCRRLEDAGFRAERKVAVFLRDRDKRLGGCAPLKVSQLDADHGFR